MVSKFLNDWIFKKKLWDPLVEFGFGFVADTTGTNGVGSAVSVGERQVPAGTLGYQQSRGHYNSA
jgi:hypothetical protein